MRLISFLFLLFLSISCLVTFPITCHGSEDILSLYERALKSDPILKKAMSQLKWAKAKHNLARSGLFPKISGQISQGYYYKKITGLAPTTLEKDYRGDLYSVTLIQPIFNGQTYVSLKMASNLINAQEAQVLAARQDIMKRVTLAYFDLLDTKAALKVAQDRVRLDEKIFEQAKAFLKIGTGDIVSVKEAKARLDAARARVITARNQVALKRENLAILVHGPVGTIKDVGPFKPKGPVPDDPDRWIRAALDNQPILIKARRELAVAREQIQYEKRARWPRLDLEAGSTYTKGLIVPDVTYRDTHALLRLTIPIYLGGSICANTAMATHQASAAREELRHLQDTFSLETKRAFLLLKDSVALIQSARQAMESARTAMIATGKGYQVGTRNIIDALDTTDKYLVRKQQYLHALYNHLKARIMLKSAAGIISEEDLRILNRLLKNQGEASPNE